MNEFFEAVHGKLSPVRRQVVREAFKVADVNGDGVLNEKDAADRYRAFLHPDGITGARTEEEVFREFLDSFDTINKDGQVSLSEFEKSYEYISALIPSDEYFVTMVRNAWSLPGATGGNCLRLKIISGVSHGRNDDSYRHPNDPRKRGFAGGI